MARTTSAINTRAGVRPASRGPSAGRKGRGPAIGLRLGTLPPDAHHGVCKACATPDFHPGSVAPVGTIVATDAEFVIPAAIGTDINCGMRLLTTGLKQAAVERASRNCCAG